MSFQTISDAANDEALAQRVRGAYAAEGVEQPDGAQSTMRWAIAADPSVADPYGYAVDAGNPNPGGDPTVITDAMLTAAVQAHPYTPPPGP
jgi:hypothetical protein